MHLKELVEKLVRNFGKLKKKIRGICRKLWETSETKVANLGKF